LGIVRDPGSSIPFGEQGLAEPEPIDPLSNPQTLIQCQHHRLRILGPPGFDPGLTGQEVDMSSEAAHQFPEHIRVRRGQG